MFETDIKKLAAASESKIKLMNLFHQKNKLELVEQKSR